MLSDPDLLDVTRRLRSAMSSFDNIQVVLEKLSSIEDTVITESVYGVLPDVVSTATKVAGVLKKIESSRQYREMTKRYNINEDQEDQEG